MKKINIKISYSLLFLIGLMCFNSCSNDSLDADTRLFRPVLNKPLSSVNNTVIVNMGKLKSAVSYKVEISRDNFLTPPLKTIETTETIVTFDNLLWNTTYQVRAQANAADSEFNSKIADFGAIKTERFPSILSIPQSTDIIDIGLKVRWTNSGNAVTDVKIFKSEDEEFTTALFSYSTTSSEQQSGLKIIKKLLPSTTYVVAIYSDTVLRGYETFTTKAALPTEGNIIDLRGVEVPLPDDGTFLNAQITKAQTELGADGNAYTTIILDGDQTYSCKGYILSKTLKLVSGYSLTTGGAVLNMNGNFNVTGSAIDTVLFDGIKIIGNGGYLFQPTNGASIGTFKIANSTVLDLRGLARLRGGTGNITNFIIDNSFLQNILDYCVIRTDAATWNFTNARFTNCTFYKIRKLINNKNPTGSASVLIDNCTFFEVAANGGDTFIDFPGAPLANLTISNSIFGHGWNVNNNTPPTYDYKFIGLGQLGNTIISFSNVWDTSDSSYTVGSTPPGNITRYSGTSTDLFSDPNNGNFTIKDKNFLGKSSAGALRWRI